MILLFLPVTLFLNAQDIDTLLDIGGYDKHFVIWEGEGIPILFESGGGNDASIWKELAIDLHQITGAPIITHDRSGYGSSEYNPRLKEDKKALISYGAEELIMGMEKLGYGKEFMLVAHSYGGLYASYLVNVFPDRVKGIVLIDASLASFYTDEYNKQLDVERSPEWFLDIKSKSKPLYYECLANRESIEIVQKMTFPSALTIIDLVAENPPFARAEDNERWKSEHLKFYNTSEKRIGVMAYNCGHYLHFDQPAIAMNAIVKLFCEVSSDIDINKIMSLSMDYNMKSINEYRKEEYAFWHSERAINAWGYEHLNAGNPHEAIKLFELNTLLFPTSANVWDSLAEGLLKEGHDHKARRMYEKSLKLDPSNENANTQIGKLINQ